MSVWLSPQDPLFTYHYDGTQIQSTNLTLLDASTTRYIQQLEVEVGELSQQYDVVCSLLYQAVLVQDASVIVMEECEARRRVVEGESGAYVDLVSLFHRVCCGGGTPPPWAVRELRDCLREESNRLARLLEAVPQKVCGAITARVEEIASSLNEIPGRGEGTQRVEVKIMSLEDAVRSLENSSRRMVAELQQQQEAFIVSQFPVQRQEGQRQSQAQKEEEKEKQRPASEPVIPPPSAAPEDSVRFQQFACRVISTLTSLFSEYMFTSEQMQRMFEHEVNILLLVRDRENMVRWNTFIEEKSSEVRCLQSQLEKLKNVSSSREDKGAGSVIGKHPGPTTTTTSDNTNISFTIEKNKTPPTLAQLYAEFAAPFVPPNVRIPRVKNLQSIGKLRRDAIRVGARPIYAERSSVGAADATNGFSSVAAAVPVAISKRDSSPAAATPEAAVRRRSGSVTLQKDTERCPTSASPTCFSAVKETQRGEANEKEKDAGRMDLPEKLSRAASISSSNSHAASSDSKPPPKQSVVIPSGDPAMKPTTSSAKKEERREIAATIGISVRQLHRKDSTSSCSTTETDSTVSSMYSHNHDETSKETSRALRPVAEVNSFDASTSDTPEKTRQSEALTTFGGKTNLEKNNSKNNSSSKKSNSFALVSSLGRGKRAASPSQHVDKNNRSNLFSDTSITLTLDTSLGSDEKPPQPRGAVKEESKATKKLPSFGWDDAPPKGRGAVGKRKKEDSESSNPSARVHTTLSDLKALAFSSHR